MKRLAALMSAIIFAGCYGSTEPATNIGEDRATLNGQGTANSGPATSHFELTSDFEPNRPTTPTRSWPAGASGPFREDALDLLVATEYSYKLCGSDAGDPSVCAQTRAFSTRVPAGDYVKGYITSFLGSNSFIGARLNVRSGPNGENPKGTVAIWFDDDPYDGPPEPIRGMPITCVAVATNRAVVLAANPNPPPTGSWIIVVQDDPEEMRIAFSENPPVQCPNPPTGGFDQFPSFNGNLVVHNAP